MKHPENEYIQAGYQYERAPTPNMAIAIASRMRLMIESEHPDEQAEARRLIALGIDEARKGK
jgi:hypothetical protein